MATINYCPGFNRALNGLRNTETYQYTTMRGRRNRSNKSSGNPNRQEAREKLQQVNHATDVHSIYCGPEIVPGDRILFIETRHTRQNTFHGKRYVRYATYTPTEARVTDRILLDPQTGNSRLKLEVDGQPREKNVGEVSLNGCWRAPWTDELSRDGVWAEILAQDDAARQNILLSGVA